MSGAPHNTPDSGWAGDPKRGAGMGRHAPSLMREAQACETEAARLRRWAIEARETGLEHAPGAACATFYSMAAGYDSEAAALETKARGLRAQMMPGAKWTLQRVRLDSGGYDAGGAYWGIGAPLYWACTDDGAESRYLRAETRDAAKAEIRETFPAARFYR